MATPRGVHAPAHARCPQRAETWQTWLRIARIVTFAALLTAPPFVTEAAQAIASAALSILAVNSLLFATHLSIHTSRRFFVSTDSQSTIGVQLTIHSIGRGTCSLSNHDCEGITVSFADGTVTERFLSFKSLARLIALKFAPVPAKGRLSGNRPDSREVKQ